MSNYVPAVNEDHQQREILQDCTKNKKRSSTVHENAISHHTNARISCSLHIFVIFFLRRILTQWHNDYTLNVSTHMIRALMY